MIECPGQLDSLQFDKELIKLQTELCHLQEHVQKEGLRAMVVFEGRDAVGKGGASSASPNGLHPL
jgi:polyphosphate kinase 2 (PPK2 family)